MGDITYKQLVGILSKDRICNEKLGVCSKPVIQELDLNAAINSILKDKPAIIQDDNFINNLYEQIDKDEHERSILKAVHISDVHLDMKYKVGSKVHCGDDLSGCCREEYGKPNEGEKVAGEWGEYNCDTPEKTVNNMLDYIVNEVKPDMIFWTGDNSAHNTWENTLEEVTNYTIHITEMIKAKLNQTEITVIPIQGNHDTWPVD